MAARSPHEALADFRRALCAAFSCVTDVVPQIETYNPAKKDVLVASLKGDEPVMLRGPGEAEIGLVVTFQYRVVTGGEGWVVQTAAYEYSLTD